MRILSKAQFSHPLHDLQKSVTKQKQYAKVKVIADNTLFFKTNVADKKISLNQVVHYTGFTAIIMWLFGKTIHVEGISCAINKKSLTKRVIEALTGNSQLAQQFKNSSLLQNKIYSLINTHGIREIQRRLDEVNPQRIENITETELFEALDKINPSRPETIEWSKDIVVDTMRLLKPGDILFFQNVGQFKEKLDYLTIVKGQKLAQKWTRGELEPASERYTHVAMYIGNGQIAEATTGTKGQEEVRIIPFDHEDVQMAKNSGKYIKVCRPQDPKIAEKAAELASIYAQDKEDIKEEIQQARDGNQKQKLEKEKLKTDLLYSKLGAAYSLLGNSKFGSQAKERVLHQAIQLANNLADPLTEKGEIQSFFCSFFVMECLQRANVMTILENSQGTSWVKSIPRIHGIKRSYQKKSAEWIKKMMEENPKALDSLLIKFDGRYVSPQKFRGIVNENQCLFSDKYVIVPPKTDN